jgi:nitrous oxidase accessory protein NosD
MKRIVSILVALALVLGFSLVMAVPALAVLPVHNVTQDTYYSTIQAAIDAASSGDTIVVAAGTYAPFKVISKDLTINGSGSVVVTGALDVSSELTLPRFSLGGKTTKAVALIKDSTVNLNGLDFEGVDMIESGTSNFGIAVIYQNSSGSVNNCVVSCNSDVSDTPDPDITIFGTYGIGIWKYDSARTVDVTIKGCTIREFGSFGITVWNGAKALIQDNTIIGQVYSIADKEIYGVNVDATYYSTPRSDGVCEATITGNEIYNCDNTEDPPDERDQCAAVHLNAYLEYYNDEAESKVTITNNDFHDNRIGIYAVHCSPANTCAHFNNIYDNRTYGVVSKPNGDSESVVFNARYNWWGANDGPGPVGPSSGDKVSANVIYDSWTWKIATYTGTGTASFTSNLGNIGAVAAVATPHVPPVVLPHGMFSFYVPGLSIGQGIIVTIELPEPVPVGTKWWKYQGGAWYSLPIGSDDGDNVITVTLRDNVFPEDADGVLNGQITDPGGPGYPGAGGAVGWETYPISKMRVLLPWIALLAAFILAASLLVLRRRRAQT